MNFKVIDLCKDGILFVEDGNHGEYRPLQHEFSTVGIPFIRPDDLKEGRVNFSSCDRINDDAFRRVRKGKGQEGDILFTHRATVGRIARVPEGSEIFVANPGVTVWRSLDHDKIDPAYLYYFMQTRRFMDQVWAEAGNTDTFPYISLNQQKSLTLTLPPIDEQRNIGRILSLIDRKIAINYLMNENLDSMARAIFKDWFVDFGPVRAKCEGRAPYFPNDIWDAFPNKFSDDGLPEGWSYKKFGELIDSHIGGDWGAESADTVNDTPVAIIRGTDIPDIIAASNLRVPVRYTTKKKLASRRLNNGDLVLEVSGGSPTQPTGRTLFITDDILSRFENPVVCATFCRLLRPKSDEYGIIAMQHMSYLYSQGGTWEYQNQSTGISNFQTSLFLEKENVVVPEDRILNIFHSTVRKMVYFMTRNENYSLSDLRDFLLPKLMSGEISVREVEKTLASAL